MRIGMFGATGRVGRQLLMRAIQDGHEVTALVRGAEALQPAAGLHVVAGDVLDSDVVFDVVNGADAIVSTLGVADPARPGNLLESGMRTITDAMRPLGVRRIVALAGAGVLDAPGAGLRHDQPDFPAEYRPISEAHLGTWRALVESGLDWSLVCTPTQTPNPPTGSWREAVDVLPPGGSEIPIGDIAAFMGELVTARRYLGRRVGIVSEE